MAGAPAREAWLSCPASPCRRRSAVHRMPVVGLPTFVSAFGNLIDRQNRAHQEAQLPETSSDDQTVDDVQALFTTPLGPVECLHPL